MAPRPVLALLAAGAGSRFAGPNHKLSSNLPSAPPDPAETVIARSIRHALDAEAGPVVVIVGSTPDIVPTELADHVLVRENPRWAAGQATSVQAAIAHAREHDHDSVVIGLADQPGITPSAWRRVANAPGPIAAATYGGRRGNPVRLDAEVWPLVPTTGDEGARTLMRVRPGLVVAVPCSGSPADIDTEEDLRRWLSN